MQSETIIITIDGPAASGKTSVSRLIAARHGWKWLSTGAFYRGLSFVATREGVSLEDEEALAKLCSEKFWEVQMSPERTLVFLHGEDCTDEIYKEINGSAASLVSRFPKVRANLLQAQRDCARGLKGLVAEGRDCGTVVFPTANLKFYLTARSADRAERRAREEGRDLEETHRAQVLRDQQDSSRATAPMQIPDEAYVIDTSNLDLNQVVAALDNIIKGETR